MDHRQLPLIFVVALAGCGSLRSETISDDELRRKGRWTARDALARRLLDLDAPVDAVGARPLRLTPLHRKVMTELHGLPLPRLSRAAEVLLGLDYEVKYHYVARVKAYVLLARDRPPTIIADEVGAPVTLPGDETPEAAFRELATQLERDLEAIREAASRVEAQSKPSPIEP